jgi:fibronectin type 3 domain-containing protein
MRQNVAASTVGTITKFSRPNPPFNLKANNVGKHIKLTWESKEQLGFKGYYIYRGTSTKNLNVIEGPVTTKTYIDTADHLSGRSDYYYAVISQNLMQDTSIYSNLVRISPNRKIETSLPNDISFYYSNGFLNISWPDTRTNDNAIEGFMVQKRKEGEKDFVSLNRDMVIDNKIIDSNLIAGVKYDYRIANVTNNKEVSDFGSSQTFYLEKPPVDVVNMFYVRNIENAIEISLPQMQFEDRKSYTIYRRDASNLQFEKLAEMDANTFKYIDKTAKSKQIYVYSISITNKDDREGVRGKSISVRKD